MTLEEFAKALPKAELHLHLAGAVKADTFLKLANKNGIASPPFNEVEELYRYDNLADFLQVYDLVAKSVVDVDDFHPITYETLAHVPKSGGRYVEFSFSPQVHHDCGVAYRTMFAGILRAMEDTERDFGLVSRAIPALNGELSLEHGRD